jgi:hypothetical protein
MEYRRMSDERQPESDPGAPAGGVFGNLPDSRPGTRSPRRDSARAARGKAGGEQPRKRAAASGGSRPRAAASPPRTTASPPKPQRPAPEAADEPAEKQGGGLEDIAWAGVAAAAEAATIGVRLASRAIEALRGNPEQR